MRRATRRRAPASSAGSTRFFDRQIERYDGSLHKRLPRRGLFMVIYALICAGMVVMFMKTPTGFLPDEDQGSIIVSYSLPEGATLEQTRGVAERISTYFREQESANVDGVFTSPASAPQARARTWAGAFVKLKDWADRPGREQRVRHPRARTRTRPRTRSHA